jgi:hypothetical protein
LFDSVELFISWIELNLAIEINSSLRIVMPAQKRGFVGRYHLAMHSYLSKDHIGVFVGWVCFVLINLS